MYDFSKVSPSDFLQSDIFQKNNKTIRHTFSINQLGSRSGPMCVGPCLRETPSLISIQNCFSLTLADEELTGFFIFYGILFALTMYAFNGFFLPTRCINFGMVHYIYGGVTAYNFQIKLHFFLCGSLFHTCSKQCRP